MKKDYYIYPAIFNYEDKETGNIKQIDETTWEVEGNVLIDALVTAQSSSTTTD